MSSGTPLWLVFGLEIKLDLETNSALIRPLCVLSLARLVILSLDFIPLFSCL